MDSVSVHSKAFAIRWVEAPPGSSVQWRIKPVKKSVGFGVFFYADPKANVSIEKGGAHPRPLSERLQRAGFEDIFQVEKVLANEEREGEYTLAPNQNGGMIAFVFDNTFSRNTAKTILFSFSISAGATSSPGRKASVVTVDQPERGPHRSSDGRYLSGVMLKKRRKKMQGFARRYFTLDTKLGLLNYFLRQKSSYLRGVMPVKICDIEANRSSREIHLDSGVEHWVLRALSLSDYETWVTAFQAVRTSAFGNVLSRQESRSSYKTVPQEHGRSSLPAQRALQAQPSQPSQPAQRTDSHWLSVSNSVRNIRSALDEFRNTDASDEGFSRRFSERLHELLVELEEIVHPQGIKRDTQALTSHTANVSLDADEFFDAEDAHPQIGARRLAPSDSNESDFSDISEASDNEEAVTRARPDHSVTEEFFDVPEPIGPNWGPDWATSYQQKSDSDDRVLHAEPSHASADDGSHDKSGVVYADDEVRSLSEAASSDESDLSPAHSVADVAAITEPVPETGSSAVSEPVAPLYPLPCSSVTRRKDIPKSKQSPPSLITMIRKSAGKDLTSITAPITSNEPISLLQKIAETLEYTELLDAAADSEDPRERVVLVTVFAVSQLSSMRCKERTLRKPFNPLLGESYELVREDKGFRFISEKVSHRPPIMATQADSDKWSLQFTSRPHQKIWGKSAEITDTGLIRITMNQTGETFEYMSPDCFLRNLIAGEKYVEPVGSITVDSSSGLSAVAEFKAGGMFSGRSEELKITVSDDPSYVVEGKWTEGLWRSEGGKKGEQVWKVGSLVTEPTKKYGWTTFAASLNEITPIEEGSLPPNDSRLRADQRLYEKQTDIDKAEELKLALEQKQRDRRKVYEDANKAWEPAFFNKAGDAQGFYALKTGPDSYWHRRARGEWSGITNVLELETS